MRKTSPEIKPYVPKHPSPFATPVIAMAIGIAVGVSAIYADYLRGNLYEELDKDYRVHDFKYILGSTTLKKDFQEEDSEYTVIVPTDQAFDKAQWETEVLASSKLPWNQPAPTPEPRYYDISAYDYVTSTPVYPEDVEFGHHVNLTSVSGNDLVFSRVSEGDGGLRVNGKPVQTVRTADNGVIYLIDDLLAFSEPVQQFSWNR